jgi:hypothetical protein
VGQVDIEAAMREFRRDGFYLIKGALSQDECRLLRAEIDDALEEYPQPPMTRHTRPAMMLRGAHFESLIDRAPAVDLCDALLSHERGDKIGAEVAADRTSCHVINMTSMVNDARDEGQHWHIDDFLFMPRPAGVPWDERIPFPVYIITVMYYLNDVGADGAPTELVPGSHKSGRKPDPFAPAPTYEGRGPHAILCETGDCVLFHNQVWHHALPNRSPESRYVLQVHYAARFIAQRFWPFPLARFPAEFLERLTPRRQLLMGMHPCMGQYT